MFDKLTPEILSGFVGGELDILNPSTCHLRGGIERMVFGVNVGGGVSSAKVWFCWLAPKHGKRIVVHQNAVKSGKEYSLVFEIEKVLLVRKGEIKVKSRENEVLTFLAPGSEGLDGEKFRES